MSFDPATLVNRLVVVTEYTFVDDRGKSRTERPALDQYGLVKKVDGSVLTIALKLGTAMPDRLIEKSFDDKGWRLAFPGKGEK